MTQARKHIQIAAVCISWIAASGVWSQPAEESAPPTMGSVLAASTDADWRPLAPSDTLVMALDSGEVVIELAPQFAPQHVENIRKLVQHGYFDQSAVVRVHENYVVQWGSPDENRPLGPAAPELPMETVRSNAPDLRITALPDGDVYAPQVGYSNGFPVAMDEGREQAWLTHCYGMVGVGRGMGATSGNGSSLYVVTGHAPRHLDKNVTLVGRVLSGMEHLTTLPRGTGPLGFYESADQYVKILSIRLLESLPAAARPNLQVMRTDTDSFRTLIEARRNRHEDWFLDPVGKLELCNMPVPIRAIPAGTEAKS